VPAPASTFWLRELLFRFHLENQLQRNRSAKWKACDTRYKTSRALFLPEDDLEQLRGTISNLWLINAATRKGYQHSEPDKSHHPLEPPGVLRCYGECDERRKTRNPVLVEFTLTGDCSSGANANT
jgi:hypothetical protein